MAMEQTTGEKPLDIFRELEEYPWDKDKEFQGGLAAILGPNPQPTQITDLTLRAQCFYLSRKRSVPIDFNAYKEYLLAKQESSVPIWARMPHPPLADRHANPPLERTDGSQDGAPYPKSFAEIVELITSGKPIPGIKEIPNITLPHLASKPMLPKRRKPWEKDVPQEQIDGNIGGVFGDHRDIDIPQEFPEEDK